MEITKDFILSEISELEQEVQKANSFLLQAQAAINVYKMLINRLDTEDATKEIS
jgi:hypothetical protein